MVLSEQLGLTRHTWTPHCTLASVNGCENSMHSSSYIGFYPRKEKYSRKVRVRMANFAISQKSAVILLFDIC